MKKKVVSCLLVFVLVIVGITGCGNNEAGKTSKVSEKITSDVTDEQVDEVTELNYWTWFPSTDQLDETIKAFEKENPDIKINMTVMQGKTFQEKVPLALTTEDDIDVIGVQPSAFATEIQSFLVDLDEVIPQVAGENWKENYSEKCLQQGNQLTNGDTKMLVLANSGSMIGYYNVALLEEIGCEVPTTIEEYKVVADKLKEKYPDKYAGVFAGKEGWVADEMLLTVLGQQGDYYNKWRYEGAVINGPEYLEAMNGLVAFFEEGIFSKDILDLDYASATEEFTNGNALVYYMGSWDSTLLSKSIRERNDINLEDVGAMALPVVKKGGKATVRSYIDCAIGIVNYSEKQEAAAKFIAYLTLGEGADIFGKQLAGTTAKKDFAVDESLFASEAGKEGWNTVVELLSTGTADRNNVSGFSDIEGAAVQSVLNGSVTPEEILEELQSEWTSGKY